jgi:hypothetical protein
MRHSMLSPNWLNYISIPSKKIFLALFPIFIIITQALILDVPIGLFLSWMMSKCLWDLMSQKGVFWDLMSQNVLCQKNASKRQKLFQNKISMLFGFWIPLANMFTVTVSKCRDTLKTITAFNLLWRSRKVRDVTVRLTVKGMASTDWLLTPWSRTVTQSNSVSFLIALPWCQKIVVLYNT